jgi:hypothetical protein
VNQAVVAKDSKEDKVGAHDDILSSKVRKHPALSSLFFLNVHV